MIHIRSTNAQTCRLRSSLCSFMTFLLIFLFFALMQNFGNATSRNRKTCANSKRFPPRGVAGKYETGPENSSTPIHSPTNTDINGCENSTSIFDSSGEACIDFDYAASRQAIYGVNSGNVSYLVCSIPKNGCTYHLGLMHRLLGFEYKGGGFVHSPSNISRLKISGDNLKRMIIDPDIEKYVVVRNPLERLLSAYLNKVEIKMQPKDRGSEIFEEWVYAELYPGMEENPSMNAHWKPQVSFCGFKMRDIWKRFRMFQVEEPSEYVDYLEEFLPGWVMRDGWNGAANVSFRDAAVGTRERTEHTSERFFTYVRSLKLFDYLVSCYRVDIERLGYEHQVGQMREHLVSSVNMSHGNDM